MNKNNWKNKPNNNFNNQRPQYIKKTENFQGNQDFNFQNGNQDDFGNQNYYYNQYQNNGNNKGQYHKRNNSNYSQSRNYNNNNKQNNNYRQYQNQNNNNFNNPNFAQNDLQNQNYRQKNQNQNQRFQNKQQQQYNDNSIPEWILDEEESTFQFGTFDKNQFKQELQQKQNSQKEQQTSENQDDLNNEETFGNNNDDDDFDPFGQDFNSSNQHQQQSQKNSQNVENLEQQQQQKQVQYNEQQKQLIKKLQDMVDPNTEILKQDFDANPSFKTNNNNKNAKQRKGSYNTNNNNQNKRKKSYNQMQQQQDFFMSQYMPEQLQNNLGMMLPPGFSQSQQQPQQNYPNLFQNNPYQQSQLANNQQANFQQQSNQQQQQQFQQQQQQQQQMQNQQIQNPFLQFSTEENLPPQEEVWKYKTDSNDSEHGPFPSEAMNQWLYEGYFAQPNMMINYTKTNKWVKVEQFLNNIGIFKEDDSQKNNQESQLKNIEDKTAAEITWEEIQEAQKIGGEKLKLVEGILLGQKIVDKPEEKEGGFDTFEEMESHNTQLDKYYYQRDKLDEVFTSKELHYYNQINRQKEAIEMQNQQMKKMMQRMNKNHKKGGIQHNGYFQAPPGFDNINLQQMPQQQLNMMPQYINFQQQQVNAQPQNMMPQMGLQGNNNPNFYGYSQNIKFNNQQQQQQQQQQGFMPPGF